MEPNNQIVLTALLALIQANGISAAVAYRVDPLCT